MIYSVVLGTPNQAFVIAQKIPEFGANSYGLSEYEKRLQGDSLVLIAMQKEQPVGFKAGYPRGGKGSFYSWMGGVLPEHREQGLARLLAEEQERRIKSQGFEKVWFKTRNQNKGMLIFAIKNGFYITRVIPKSTWKDYRIILEKLL